MMKIFWLFVFASMTTSLCSAQGPQVRVVLHSIEGYGPHEDFARRAAAAFERVVNSDEFRRIVRDTVFTKTKGLTNLQLLDRIMMAHEEVGPGGADNVIDLRVRTLRVNADESGWRDNCQTSTIGIDGTGDGVTAVCPNRLQEWAANNELDELAGHYAHEYMHILGFDHHKRLRGQRWREKTFVYVVGNIVAALAKKIPPEM